MLFQETELRHLLDQDYPNDLFGIAHGWDAANRFDLAVGLYGELYQHYPDIYTPAADLKARYDKSRAMWASQTKDIATLDTAVKDLQDDGQGPEQLKVMYQVAVCCHDEGESDQSQQLFTHIAETGRSADQFRSRMVAAMALLALDRTSEADQVMEAMITDFKDEPRLGEAVLEYGWSSFDQARKLESVSAAGPKLNLAVTWLSRFLDQYPSDSEMTIRARLARAQCWQRLGQYGQARLAYEQWLDDYSGHPSAPYVYLRLENCYDAMLLEGQISEEEHDKLVTALHEQLLVNYPDSQEAGVVRQEMAEVPYESSDR